MTLIEGNELVNWLKDQLRRSRRVAIVSPFITSSGLAAVRQELSKPRRQLEVIIATQLDPLDVLVGALDIDALKELLFLSTDLHPVTVYAIPNLHAKVHLADERVGVVGSGNMTRSGTEGGNVELGVVTATRREVHELWRRLQTWVSLGQELTTGELDRYQKLVEDNFGKLRNEITNVSVGNLQIFPGPNSDYFSAMLSTLRLATVSGGCSRATVLDALRNEEQGKPGAKTPVQRLLFLEYIGMLQSHGDKVVASSEAEALLRGRDSTRRYSFAQRLMKLFPSVRRVYEVLKCSPSDAMTYEEIRTKTTDQHSSRQPDEIENIVRWLRCMKLAEDVKPF